MKDVFSMVQAIAPDLKVALQTRYDILYHLNHLNQSLGRKALAEKVNLSERSLRTIIELMKEQQLVKVDYSGIRLTEHGKILAEMISNNEAQPNRLRVLENRLKEKLNISECWVVPGDVEEDEIVYQYMSQAVQNVLDRFLKFGQSTIAVTGGETLAHIGEGLTPELSANRELVFVPARGGVGGGFNIQSNIIGGVMAQKTQAKYVPLFIPDSMEEDASKAILSDPSVLQAVTMGKQADCLLVSVGSAKVMAERRELTLKQQQLLKQEKAIGEVFGVFFNEEGHEVLRLPRLGIQLEEIMQIPLVLTIVGGASKARAVKGYCRLIPNHGWLICDEGVASMILNEETH